MKTRKSKCFCLNPISLRNNLPTLISLLGEAQIVSTSRSTKIHSRYFLDGLDGGPFQRLRGYLVGGSLDPFDRFDPFALLPASIVLISERRIVNNV